MSIKMQSLCDSSTDIGREILSFLIPEPKSVEFYKHSPNTFNNAYSSKYERAYANNKLLENKNGKYLSRISKKNGKYRYYITKVMIDENEVEHNDRMVSVYYYDYVSTYVGKNLETALLSLLA
jgi:hypothetical protein